MSPLFFIARNNISPTIRRYAEVMKRGLVDVVNRAARGITRRVVDVTPPASKDSTGRDARRAGEQKIERNMESVLIPKRLKGRRRITTVFGRRPRRPVYAITKELHPDVAGIYRNSLRTRSGGVGISVSTGKKFYVDVRKFDAELKRRQGKVGSLAAGWAAGADALDVPMQQWIARHGTSGGRVQIEKAGDRMRVVVENFAPGLPANLRGELARRMNAAVDYQRSAMEREIAAMADKSRRESGIKSAA